MLRKVYGLAAIAMVASVVTVPNAVAAEKQFLRYSQWLPPGHWSQRELMWKWFKEIDKATEGRVVIQPTAKSLGAPPRQYQLAVDGITDVGYQVHGYTPGTFPLSEMAELPFITKSAEANSVAYWRVFKKMFEPAGMHKDVHTLSLFVHVPGQVYNNKRQINSLADFKGLKLRIPNYITAEAIKRLGGVPILAPVTKLRDGLSKRVFDGTCFTDEAVYAFKIGKFVKHATHIPGGLYNLSLTVVMNKGKWNKISAKDRATINAMAGEVMGGHRMGRKWDEREVWAPSQLKKDGVTWNTISGRNLVDLKAKLAIYEEQWIGKAKKAGVDGKAALKMFRAEIDKYGS
jgi:TRAP-type C4-dicarboxylate transport system substrate-binding protein